MTAPTAPIPTLRASGGAAGALAGGLIVASSFLPLWAVAVVFVGLGAVVAWGWPRLLDLPSPRGTSAVLAATTAALVAVMLVSPEGERTRWAGAVVSVGLIGSFLHQLLRQDGRPRLVMSLAGTALGLGILGAGSYVVPSRDDTVARDLLVAAGLSVVVGSLIDAATGATQRRIELGVAHVVLGGLVGAVAVIAGADPLPAMCCGAVGGLLAWSTLRTTVMAATSGHTRAQVAAGCACALTSCFVPLAMARILQIG